MDSMGLSVAMKSGQISSRPKNMTDLPPKGSWGFGKSTAIYSVKSRLVKYDYLARYHGKPRFLFIFRGSQNLQFFHGLLGSKGTIPILWRDSYMGVVWEWQPSLEFPLWGCLFKNKKKMMAVSELRGGYLFEDVWRMTFSTNGLMVNRWFLKSPDERDWDS